MASNDAADIDLGNVPHVAIAITTDTDSSQRYPRRHSAQLTTLTARFQRSGALRNLGCSQLVSLTLICRVQTREIMAGGPIGNGLRPHVPGIYRYTATALGASMWFFVSPSKDVM